MLMQPYFLLMKEEMFKLIYEHKYIYIYLPINTKSRNDFQNWRVGFPICVGGVSNEKLKF